MPPKAGHALVSFEEEPFGSDLQRLNTDARNLALSTRRSYESDGVPLGQLRKCDSEGRDGTSLPECLKIYLPAPHGRFGMVLNLTVDPDGPQLEYLAFGVRHHPPGSNALTVYQLAHRRLQRERPS